MLHISLFSGIGGFDLAAEWMGWTNIISCEINDFGNKVLEHYWPNAYHHRDVKTLTLEKINEELGENWRTDDVILTGGFPCQPYSSAGKRKGKEDERHLWPEMLRVIREIKPSYIVGENVAGLLSWSGGLVFDEVHSDLEAEGYEVQAVVIPAAAVNAPHGRDRVWFVARHSKSNGNAKIKQVFGGKDSNTIGICNYDAPHSNGSSDGANQFRSIRQEDGKVNRERTQAIHNAFGSDGNERTAPHSNGNTTQPSGKSGSIEASWSGNNDEQDKWGGKAELNNRSPSFSWDATHSNSNGLHTSDSGHEEQPSEGRLNAQRDADEMGKSNVFNTQRIGRIEKRNDHGIIEKAQQKECGQKQFSRTNSPQDRWWNFPTVSPVCSRNDGISHKLDGITFSKWRKESIKAAGNAVVPQVVYEIFKAIEATRK